MEFLDSDGRVLRHNGRAAARDIVQFVGKLTIKFLKFCLMCCLQNRTHYCCSESCFILFKFCTFIVFSSSWVLCLLWLPYLYNYFVKAHKFRRVNVDVWIYVSEMRKYMTQGYGYQQSGSYSKQDLTRAVLHELPDQLVLWMKKLKPVC